MCLRYVTLNVQRRNAQIEMSLGVFNRAPSGTKIAFAVLLGSTYVTNYRQSARGQRAHRGGGDNRQQIAKPILVGYLLFPTVVQGGTGGLSHRLG